MEFPQHKRDQIFAGYTQADYASLDFDWSIWGRLEQIAPPGTWDNWLILAGRGFGKTRKGAEWVRANMCGDTPLTGGRWRHEFRWREVPQPQRLCASRGTEFVGKASSGVLGPSCAEGSSPVRLSVHQAFLSWIRGRCDDSNARSFPRFRQRQHLFRS